MKGIPATMFGRILMSMRSLGALVSLVLPETALFADVTWVSEAFKYCNKDMRV